MKGSDRNERSDILSNQSLFSEITSILSHAQKWTLSAAGLVVLLTGCAMEHGTLENPSSTPIPTIDFEALYVVNGGSNSVSVINTATNEIKGTIMLQNAAYPHHVYLSPDISLLALAFPGADLSGGHSGGHGGHAVKGSLLVMEAATGKTKVSRTFESSNHNAVFSPDGKEIWTSQMTSPGKVLVLNASTLATLSTIAVGDLPAEVTFTRDGKYAFSANGQSNNVTVMDAVTKTVVKTIAVGLNPVGAWPGNDSIMYVDNETAKTISAIQVSTLEIVRTYSLGFTPGMATTSPSGDLWVTDSENGKVVIFTAGTIVKSSELATGAGAHGIAFSKDGNTAYVSNQMAGSVTVIDVVGLSVKKNLTVGSMPNGMAIR
jgi:YVTN family beta-propeller protein